MGNEIRVSIICLCIIRNQAAQYLLGVNENRRHREYQVLMPLGGAYYHDAESGIRHWILNYEKPDSLELRFTSRVENLPQIEQWFLSRKERETTPLRELYEELVLEYKVLPTLSASHVEMKFVGNVIRDRITDRTGAEGKITHYLIELFEVNFVANIFEKAMLSDKPESGLFWVTTEDIKRRFLHNSTLQIDAEIILTPHN